MAYKFQLGDSWLGGDAVQDGLLTISGSDIRIPDAGKIGVAGDHDLLTLESSLLSVSGALWVEAGADFAGDVLIAGASLSSSDDLYAGQDIRAQRNIEAIANISARGTLVIDGLATVGGTLGVTGVGSFSSHITASGDIYAGVDMIADGQIEAGTSVFALGGNMSASANLLAGGKMVVDNALFASDGAGNVNLVSLTASGEIFAMGGMALDGTEAHASIVATDSMYFTAFGDDVFGDANVAAFITASANMLAGTGITATDGTLNVSAVSAPSSFGSGDATLVEGLNWGNAAYTGSATLTLPGLGDLDNGERVMIKMPAQVSAGKSCTIAVDDDTTESIDGSTSLLIESPYGAVSLYRVNATTWRIF